MYLLRWQQHVSNKQQKTGDVVERSTKHPFGTFHVSAGSLVPGDGVMMGYGKAQSLTSKDEARYITV